MLWLAFGLRLRPEPRLGMITGLRLDLMLGLKLELRFWLMLEL